MKRIGIFAGSKIAPNLKKLLFNLGKMLENEFHLDLIGSAKIDDDLKCIYDQKTYFGSAEAEGIQRIKQAFYNCREYSLKEQPDVLFQITKYPIYSLPVSTVGKLFSIPTIIRLSGDHFREYKIKRYDIEELTRILIMNNILSTIPLKMAESVIVISDQLRKEAIRKGCKKDKIEVIPQPINSERFNPPSKEEKNVLREKYGFPKNKKIVIYVGRLTKPKGLPILEKTISQIENQDILFCLIGKGEFGPKLEEKYPSKVRLEGFVEQNRIQDYYKLADLLIHPSPLEGVPNTLLEAMSTELAIIAKKADYSEELGVPTFEDWQELTKMIDNDWITTSLPERFMWDNLKSKYVDLINKTISKGRI
ncbi:MAG: glycosyltransferase family 4 protein [Thermoplasmatota archaeon]